MLGMFYEDTILKQQDGENFTIVLDFLKLNFRATQKLLSISWQLLIFKLLEEDLH